MIVAGAGPVMFNTLTTHTNTLRSPLQVLMFEVDECPLCSACEQR
jgi:hypothetical protein